MIEKENALHMYAGQIAITHEQLDSWPTRSKSSRCCAFRRKQLGVRKRNGGDRGKGNSRLADDLRQGLWRRRALHDDRRRTRHRRGRLHRHHHLRHHRIIGVGITGPAGQRASDTKAAAASRHHEGGSVCGSRSGRLLTRAT